jgi:hypothetical protein
MLFTWTDTRSTMSNQQTTMNQYINFNCIKANPSNFHQQKQSCTIRCLFISFEGRQTQKERINSP